jgi:hypothetical protein
LWMIVLLMHCCTAGIAITQGSMIVNDSIINALLYSWHSNNSRFDTRPSSPRTQSKLNQVPVYQRLVTRISFCDPKTNCILMSISCILHDIPILAIPLQTVTQ